MAFLTQASNRGSISTGYDIDNSLKLESNNGERIQSTNLGTASSSQTFTLSCWVKRTELGGHPGILNIQTNTGTTVQWQFAADSSTDSLYQTIHDSTMYTYSKTKAVFRDTSAWYHCMWVVDSTNGTAADRSIVYVNGVRQELEQGHPSHPLNIATQNQTFPVQATHYIGGYDGGNNGFRGYISDYYHLDGVAASPTDFGEYDDNGIWVPIEADVTYGNRGYFLNFQDSANLGKDTGPNTHGNFSHYGGSAIDQATDTPTNNFCTLNPLSYNVPYAATEGNTKWSKSDTTYGMASGTHYVAAGKWYWEIKATDFGTYSSCSFGIIDAHKLTVDANERGYKDPSLSANSKDILAMSGAPNGWYMNSNSTIANNGSTNSVDYTFYEGDILAFALDMDNGGYWMGNSRYSGVANGSFWIAPGGTTTSGSVATTDPTNGNYALVGNGGGTNNGTPNFNGGTINGGSLLTAGFTFVTPLLGAYHSNTTVTLEVNFGGFTSYGETGGYSDANGYGNFAYSVPSGFYALCSKNIAEFGGT